MKKISLTRGLYAIVDNKDFLMLQKYKWKAHWFYRKRYVYADYKQIKKGKEKYFLMHRIITKAKKGEFIDHINKNTLDNRRKNLRIVTNMVNQRNCKLNSKNTSGFCGVSWNKTFNKWEASIGVNNKKIFLGRFSLKSEAISARKKADIKYKFHKNHGIIKKYCGS